MNMGGLRPGLAPPAGLEFISDRVGAVAAPAGAEWLSERALNEREERTLRSPGLSSGGGLGAFNSAPGGGWGAFGSPGGSGSGAQQPQNGTEGANGAGGEWSQGRAPGGGAAPSKNTWGGYSIW